MLLGMLYMYLLVMLLMLLGFYLDLEGMLLKLLVMHLALPPEPLLVPPPMGNIYNLLWQMWVLRPLVQD
uniref:Uncharacterized protein n=1 Tax=Picea glauca TaxID=3330 RepID=A0A101LYS2_PICGL|nr:hypothetical protein ABT39_MTgene4845 [Picea glauca]QHR88666.1 hypothetical protein Q903MT_gene2680 [Picea sitchensis]